MMRLRRASAIAALCVLASAATATAECAWVLWADNTPMAKNMIPLAWKPLNSYMTQKDCEQAKARVWRADTAIELISRLPHRHRGPARAEGEVNEEDSYGWRQTDLVAMHSCGKELAVTERKANASVTYGSGKPTHCPFCGKDGLRDNGETGPDQIGPWR